MPGKRNRSAGPEQVRAPTFVEVVQAVAKPDDIVEIGLRTRDGHVYSIDITAAIIPALISVLAGRCHKSLEAYQSPSNRTVHLQPLRMLAGRTLTGATRNGLLSLLTHLGVEIVLDLGPPEQMESLRTEIATLEAAIRAMPAKPM